MSPARGLLDVLTAQCTLRKTPRPRERITGARSVAEVRGGAPGSGAPPAGARSLSE
jgi:hypothetical protein